MNIKPITILIFILLHMPIQILAQDNATAATIEQLEKEMYRIYPTRNVDEFMDVTERLNGGDEHQGSFLEMESNAPIGLWPEIDFIGEEIETIKDRPLFIYSDGLNEAENSKQERFGDDHMLDILRHTKFKDARHVVELMEAEVKRHRADAESSDDMTIMCLKAKNSN